jgi:hypothetical protein
VPAFNFAPLWKQVQIIRIGAIFGWNKLAQRLDERRGKSCLVKGLKVSARW